MWVLEKTRSYWVKRRPCQRGPNRTRILPVAKESDERQPLCTLTDTGTDWIARVFCLVDSQSWYIDAPDQSRLLQYRFVPVCLAIAKYTKYRGPKKSDISTPVNLDLLVPSRNFPMPHHRAITCATNPNKNHTRMIIIHIKYFFIQSDRDQSSSALNCILMGWVVSGCRTVSGFDMYLIDNYYVFILYSFDFLDLYTPECLFCLI